MQPSARARGEWRAAHHPRARRRAGVEKAEVLAALHYVPGALPLVDPHLLLRPPTPVVLVAAWRGRRRRCGSVADAVADEGQWCCAVLGEGGDGGGGV